MEASSFSHPYLSHLSSLEHEYQTIGKAQKGDKLEVSNGVLSFSGWGLLKGFSSMWGSTSTDSSWKSVSQKIHEINQATQQAVLQIESSSGELDNNVYEHLNVLNQSIRQAENGLNVLKSSYPERQVGDDVVALKNEMSAIADKVHSLMEKDRPSSREMEEDFILVSNDEPAFISIDEEVENEFTKLSSNDSLANTSSPLSSKAPSESIAQEATRELSAYCKAFCPNITLSQSQEFIKTGRILVRDILEGKRKPSLNPEESQKELTAISWFLLSCALEKGQGHDEGAFMIEDPKNRLYDFLSQSPGYNSGYRLSSHLKGRTPRDNHGVDVVNGLLPAGKRTILFEKADCLPGSDQEKVLFFKLENYSPFTTTGYGLDTVMHGYELVVAQVNKVAYPGSDDLPTMRKERVPSEATHEFKELIKELTGITVGNVADEFFLLEDTENEPLPKSKEDEIREFVQENKRDLFSYENALNNAQIWGIAYMNQFLTKIPEEEKSKEVRKRIDKLQELLRPLDHLDKRTGREVYLTQEELSNFLK